MVGLVLVAAVIDHSEVDWPPFALYVWLAVLAALTMSAVYFIGKTRSKPIQHELTANDLLSKFGELHSKGVLSDAEFRTIKTNLAAKLQEQLNNNNNTG